MNELLYTNEQVTIRITIRFVIQVIIQVTLRMNKLLKPISEK